MSTFPTSAAALPDRSYRWSPGRLFVYAVTVVGLLMLYQWMAGSRVPVDLEWFVIVGLGGVVLGLVNGLIAMAYYRSFRGRSLLFLAAGFIGAALLDGMHLVQLIGPTRQLLPDGLTNPSGWGAVAARLYLAILLLAGWRASQGWIASTSAKALPNRSVVALSIGLWSLLFGLALALSRLPQIAAIDGLTQLAAVLTGSLFCLLLVVFLTGGDWRRFRSQHLFVVALILLVASEWLFMPSARYGFDSMLLAGDLLRAASYVLIFGAFCASTSDFFEQASSIRLEQRVNALMSRLDATQGAGYESLPAAEVERFTHAGTFELDLATGRLTGNRATRALLGQGPYIDNVRTLGELAHPDDRARLTEALIRSEADGELFRQEFRVLRQGDYRWLEAVAGIEFVNGRPARLLGYLDDVTGRKQIEHEMEAIFRDLDQIVTAVDHDALTANLDIEGRITAINRNFCTFCGVDEEALVGRAFEQGASLVPDRSGSETERAAPWTGKISLRHPSGRDCTAAGSITPHRDEHGAIDSVIFLGFDITDRVEAEMALKASNEAHRRSNEDLQMFAHIVSHDLQEPLRMVTSFMNLLVRRHNDQLNDEAREYVQFAVEGAARMGNLLDGLLEYSRVQTCELVFEELNLEEPLKDALENLALTLRETGATVEIGTLPAVQCDRSQMMQLFQNLLSNAIKFCRSGPPVIRIGSRHIDGRWIVDVEDNGIGFEAAHVGRIFQIFQRLNGRDEFPGTGVGLAICARIMERHGGRIEVDSTPGEGSRFSLCF